MKKKFTCFIFARGGSKAIKKKNIVNIKGKPLIYYTIKEAKKSKFINKIIVSTDDKDIKKVAKKYKLDVINRPSYLCKDNSNELDAWKHAIYLDQNKLKENDLFISLPATSPLRNVEDIDKGIAKFLKNKKDILIGITPSHRNPYLNMVEIKKNKPQIIINKKKFFRRQDSPKTYDITTVIYIARRKYLMKCKSILDGRVDYIIIPKERSLDIDDKIDLKIARYMIKK